MIKLLLQMPSPLSELFSSPTSEQYSALIHAYDYFNRKLFDGILPGCVFSFSSKRNTTGFISPTQWRRMNENKTTIHEISLTQNLLCQESINLFAGLVHEMCHLWQLEYGTPSRNGYHNKEWSHKMITLGLMPTSTGEIDGATTGQSISQYVLFGRLYERCFEQLPNNCLVPLMSNITIKRIPFKSKNKTKYRCSECGVNIWGRPNLKIICGSCRKPFGEA